MSHEIYSLGDFTSLKSKDLIRVGNDHYVVWSFDKEGDIYLIPVKEGNQQDYMIVRDWTKWVGKRNHVEWIKRVDGFVYKHPHIKNESVTSYRDYIR